MMTRWPSKCSVQRLWKPVGLCYGWTKQTRRCSRLATILSSIFHNTQKTGHCTSLLHHKLLSVAKLNLGLLVVSICPLDSNCFYQMGFTNSVPGTRKGKSTNKEQVLAGAAGVAIRGAAQDCPPIGVPNGVHSGGMFAQRVPGALPLSYL